MSTMTRRLVAQRTSRLFSENLGNNRIVSRTVGPGDMLELSIWEAAPATLFSTLPSNANAIATSRLTTLPEQSDDDDGFIMVPFAGRVVDNNDARTAFRNLVHVRGKGIEAANRNFRVFFCKQGR
jgi:protein involved in polysaccharide export with SLBB domain